jgi:hypothetical protein
MANYRSSWGENDLFLDEEVENVAMRRKITESYVFAGELLQRFGPPRGSIF